jgi:hypothetical protein
LQAQRAPSAVASAPATPVTATPAAKPARLFPFASVPLAPTPFPTPTDSPSDTPIHSPKPSTYSSRAQTSPVPHYQQPSQESPRAEQPSIESPRVEQPFDRIENLQQEQLRSSSDSENGFLHNELENETILEERPPASHGKDQFSTDLDNIDELLDHLNEGNQSHHPDAHLDPFETLNDLITQHQNKEEETNPNEEIHLDERVEEEVANLNEQIPPPPEIPYYVNESEFTDQQPNVIINPDEIVDVTEETHIDEEINDADAEKTMERIVHEVVNQIAQEKEIQALEPPPPVTVPVPQQPIPARPHEPTVSEQEVIQIYLLDVFELLT